MCIIRLSRRAHNVAVCACTLALRSTVAPRCCGRGRGSNKPLPFSAACEILQIQAHIEKIIPSTLLQLTKMAVTVSLLAHYVACGFYFIAVMTDENGTDTWLSRCAPNRIPLPLHPPSPPPLPRGASVRARRAAPFQALDKRLRANGGCACTPAAKALGQWKASAAGQDGWTSTPTRCELGALWLFLLLVVAQSVCSPVNSALWCGSRPGGVFFHPGLFPSRGSAPAFGSRTSGYILGPPSQHRTSDSCRRCSRASALLQALLRSRWINFQWCAAKPGRSSLLCSVSNRGERAVWDLFFPCSGNEVVLPPPIYDS